MRGDRPTPTTSAATRSPPISTRRYDAKANEELESLGVAVAVAGRMMLKRVMGKACFATLQDMTGRIQLYVTLDAVGAEALDAFKHWDLGDIVGATGTLFKTKTGELTVKAQSIRLLSKALRPLPEKFHGLTDQEQRYRQRYVDLLTNDDARRTFVARSRIVQAIREFFVARGYLEVETPMMHPIPGRRGGAPVRHASQRARHESCSCGSRRSSTSRSSSSAASRRCSRSTATSGTRGSRPGTTPSSRCSSSTRRTRIIAT